MKEYSFKLGIGYDEEFMGLDAITELVQISGDALSEKIKALPGVKWAGGDADEDPIIYQLIVVGDISRNVIEAFLEYESNNNGGDGDLISWDFDEEVDYVNSGRPMDEMFSKGGFLYEVKKVGGSEDLRDTMMGAKNIDELKEQIKAKYGSTKGITAHRRSKTSGAFYQVKLADGGKVVSGIPLVVLNKLSKEIEGISHWYALDKASHNNATALLLLAKKLEIDSESKLDKILSEYKKSKSDLPFYSWANKYDKGGKFDIHKAIKMDGGGAITTNADIQNAIDNQEKIDNSNVETIAKRITKIVGGKYSVNGIRLDNSNVKVEFAKRKREIRLFDKNNTYTFFTNPKYKEEYGHVRGLSDQWFGIYENYLIQNFGGGFATIYQLSEAMDGGGNLPIESKRYPGQFTIGEDDGEKAMYTKEELDLMEEGYVIELELNASRRGKAEMEAYQKEFKFETKLTQTDDEFGGRWRVWKKVEKLMIGGKLEKIPADELEAIYLQSEKSGQDLDWVLKQYGYTMADYENSTKGKMLFKDGGKVDSEYVFKSDKYGTHLFKGNVNQGIDITKSTTNEYGYVITVEPTSSFYHDFEPTTTETIEQAKKYVLKQVSYKYDKGGNTPLMEETDTDYKLEYISNQIRQGNTEGYNPYWKLNTTITIDDNDVQQIAELVEQGYHEGKIEGKNGWWSVEVEDTFSGGGKVGQRIKMIKMSPDPHPIEPGAMGTIRLIDGLGQIHVNWDNGRTLAVIPEVDEYEIMGEGKKSEEEFLKDAYERISDFFGTITPEKKVRAIKVLKDVFAEQKATYEKAVTLSAIFKASHPDQYKTMQGLLDVALSEEKMADGGDLKAEIRWKGNRPKEWKNYFDIWEELTISGKENIVKSNIDEIKKYVPTITDQDISGIARTDYRNSSKESLSRSQLFAWLVFAKYWYTKADIKKYNKAKYSTGGAINFIKESGLGYSVHSRLFGGWNLQQNGMHIGKYSNEQVVEFAENIGYAKMESGGKADDEEDDEGIDYNNISELESELSRLVTWKNNSNDNKGADGKIESLRKRIKELKK